MSWRSIPSKGELDACTVAVVPRPSRLIGEHLDDHLEAPAEAVMREQEMRSSAQVPKNGAGSVGVHRI